MDQPTTTSPVRAQALQWENFQEPTTRVWSPGVVFHVGSRCGIPYSDGSVDQYQCLETHTSSDSFDPRIAPSRWKRLRSSRNGPISSATSLPKNYKFVPRGIVRADINVPSGGIPATAQVWNTGVEYEESSYCCLMMPDGKVQLFKCIRAHTSSESKKPTDQRGAPYWIIAGRQNLVRTSPRTSPRTAPSHQRPSTSPSSSSSPSDGYFPPFAATPSTEPPPRPRRRSSDDICTGQVTRS
ncbi:hypothetical protein JAAARDRAFT_668666 [Jaapia argillacea MUCL 33604]|uniref:Uncharacterized protein n=1 Tax=Jaapia argillacea MUCL 33604 TaxID=933084 RepID=A0A067PX70_9AGAM|nr:hypothetical protein JAAARDRAFT_668666 [Jaapia argillacea MUCL 33604]